MAELSAVPFSALPTSDDGYTLLNDNGIVHRSSKKLSELVDDDISGKLDKSQYAVDSATFLTAHQDISNKLDTTAFSTVSGDFLTEHQPISANEWNDVYETVVANSGTWETETVWTDDINAASANAYEQAIAQIPAPFDPTFLSGEIDKKLDKTFSSNFYPMTGNPSGFLTEHQDISNKLDETAFSTVSGDFLTEHQDISNKLDTSSFSEVSSTFLTNEDITGKMDNSYSSNFYPMESNPRGYLTEHQPLDEYATQEWVENKNYLTNEDIEGKLDTTSFSDVSGSFLTAHQDISNKMDKSESANFYPMTGNPSGFLTAHQDISNKLDTTAFSTVSGDFLTEHQNLDEYATQEWVNNKGFLTEHQPISADEWNDVYETVVANSGTWGTETDWEPDIISASNNAYNSAVEWVKNQNYLTEHQDISNKLDTSSFSDVSGSFLTAHQDISNKMDKSESANFYPMTGNPSGFLTEHQDISNKLDETAFSTVSSNFLTAHQSLKEYATIDYVNTEIGKIGSFELVNLNKDNKPDVNEPSTKKIYLTKEIDSEKSDPYTEWIYNDTTSAWECIGETTLDLVNYYTKSETSGAAEISAALDLKEDKLTFAGKNNTITAINNSAIGGGSGESTTYNNGYLINIDSNNNINIRNNNCKANTDNYAYAFGTNTTATGFQSFAIGNSTKANGNCAFAEGSATSADGNCAHSEGLSTKANGYCSHAEGQSTIAQDICDHVEGMGGISNFGGCNHIEGFQYINYIKKYTTTSDISTNKIIFNNPSNWSVPGLSFTESKYSLSDFISNFKDFFKVSLDYTNSSDYHKTINKNFYKPDLYNIIEVVLTNENKIEVTIDRNLPANLPTNNEIYLIGPVAFDSVYNSGNGYSPGTRIETITISNLNDQSKKGLNIENVRTDNTFLIINCNYTTIDGKKYLFDRISSFSKIEYNDSGYIFTLKNPIIFPDDINPGDYSFNIYSINSIQYGCNHIEGLGNAIIGAGVSHIEGFKNVIKGSCSHAEGEGTSALGIISHTEGIKTYTETNSSGSHAEGDKTSAIGNSSHTEGFMTYAKGSCSHAEGYMTSAIGYGSHAEGQQTFASADFSHSEGQQTSAISIGSHAEGQSSKAYNWAHSEGNLTLASGNYSHSEGYNTSAIDSYAHSEGNNTLAKGSCSHAEGDGTSAMFHYTHTEGHNTFAHGDHSHAEGDGTSAIYPYSHTEGYMTLASAHWSHTEGSQTYTFGDCSHAEGSSTSSFGVGSHTEGLGTLAYDDYMHVCGQYNATNRSALFVIGNGTSANHSDAMIVSANGVVSAYDYYNATGDKLSDLTEIISLLRNKPTTGTHVIKCIDGVLTWVAEP